MLGATVMVILNDHLVRPPPVPPSATGMEALDADMAVLLELASAGSDLAVERATRGLPGAQLERERQWARPLAVAGGGPGGLARSMSTGVGCLC